MQGTALDQAAGQQVGYWGPVTASIDWCEDNYVVTEYIAEFYNTVSNIFLVVLGYIGVRMCVREGLGQNRDLLLLFATIALVGLGSALFHGTLLKVSQQADETPMIIAVTQYVYLLWKDKLPYTSGKLWPTLIWSHNIAFAVLHWKYEWVTAFQVYFGIWSVLAAVRLRHMYKHDLQELPVVRRLIKWYFFTWLFGVAVWQVDFHMCHHVNQLPINPQGHAWWHMSVGVASFLGPLALAFVEAKKRGLNPSIRFHGGLLPLIHTKEKM